jgi:hypothetical protein
MDLFFQNSPGINEYRECILSVLLLGPAVRTLGGSSTIMLSGYAPQSTCGDGEVYFKFSRQVIN